MLFILGGTGFQPVVFALTDGQDARPTVRQTEPSSNPRFPYAVGGSALRCKNCDYPLWNIKARACPECGEAFRPTEFDFVPHSVIFHCPHCEQVYYGTDSRGHLEPLQFPCAKCQQLIHMDQTVVAPAKGVDEKEARLDHMPWLERGEGRFVKPWFATIKWAMLEPHRLIRATPVDIPFGRAWLFGLITAAMFLLIGFYIPVLVYGAAVSFGMGQSGMGGMWFSIGGVTTLLVGIVVVGVYLLLWAAIAHGVLKMTGNTAHTFRRTCHAIFYSAPAGVFLLIPLCNILFGLVWWIASAAIMIKESQRVHGARAAIAVFVWPLISVYLLQVITGLQSLFIIGMLMSFAFGGGFGGRTFGGGMPASMETSAVAQAVLSSANSSNGIGATHALELTLGGNMIMSSWGSNFCHPNTQTTPADIPVGDGTFQDFINSSRSSQLGAIKDAIDAMPSNVVAHRFGDFVFTYHGAALNSWDTRLWVVVMLPDPDVNDPPSVNDPIYVGTADYNVTQTTFGQLPTQIRWQNQHRATLGLPPLPDLTTVTHDKPAVAGQQPTGGDPNKKE